MGQMHTPLVDTKKSRGFFECLVTVNELCFTCFATEYLEMDTYKWAPFVNCVVAVYIIDLCTYKVKTCHWMVMFIYHFKQGFPVFIFLHF